MTAQLECGVWTLRGGEEHRGVRQQLPRPVAGVRRQHEEGDHLHHGAPLAVVRVAAAWRRENIFWNLQIFL